MSRAISEWIHIITHMQTLRMSSTVFPLDLLSIRVPTIRFVFRQFRFILIACVCVWQEKQEQHWRVWCREYQTRVPSSWQIKLDRIRWQYHRFMLRLTFIVRHWFGNNEYQSERQMKTTASTRIDSMWKIDIEKETISSTVNPIRGYKLSLDE